MTRGITRNAIISREEILRLLEAAASFKHRALLMTAYAAGLRVGELIRLKLTNIDSDRMCIRVEQGKGAKDRYTLLSARLLGHNSIHSTMRYLHLASAKLLATDSPLDSLEAPTLKAKP